MTVQVREPAPEARRSVIRDLSVQALLQGLVVALVGYAASVAVVVQGLKAVGASVPEITSALVVMGLAKGVVAIGLSLWLRMPLSIAWTTPGFALLAASATLPGGFPAAVGAFIVAGALLTVAAFWPPLARLVAAIPKSIANAMLAGILLKLALVPFMALAEAPWSVGAVMAVWLAMLMRARLYAVPAAAAVAVAIMAATGAGGVASPPWPLPVVVVPAFSLEAMLAVALPLFIVTMASQNIPGFAVLAAHGYRPPAGPSLGAAGAASLAIAPFGGGPVNMAAITAALCAGSDAHADPARRYVAAVMAGVGYIGLAALAGVAAVVATGGAPLLVGAVAGLALMGALATALATALAEEEERLPAMVTFLVAGSGFTLMGVGGAFWGLVAGWGLHHVLRRRAP